MSANPWTCPSCATPNAASARFCSECGGKRTLTDVSMSGERTMAGETPRPASSPDLTIGADRTITGGEATAYSAQPQASAGQRVGRDARYELVSKLGEGGMGAVWKARDTQLGREVALKRMLGSASRVMRERFQRETQAMVGLRHPNVVTLYDAGEDAHGLYIVMEYVVGKTLAAHLAGGALPAAQANEVITGVCRGAAHAHKKGVVHRDIKPGNIMIDEDGTPRLLDFGLVRMEEASELSMAGVGMGTLDYAAPEQKRDASKADARSDVYALGLVIYETLTGMRPPVSLKRVPAAWRPLIEKATDPVPEERHATADALLADVVALTSQPASSAALPAVGDGEDDLRCPKCAQANALEARVCRACGTSLRANCMACGESIRVGLKNCDRCFASQGKLIAVAKEVDAALSQLAMGDIAMVGSALANAKAAASAITSRNDAPLRRHIEEAEKTVQEQVDRAHAMAAAARESEREGNFQETEGRWRAAVALDQRLQSEQLAFMRRRPAAELALQTQRNAYEDRLTALEELASSGSVEAGVASCTDLAAELGDGSLAWQKDLLARVAAQHDRLLAQAEQAQALAKSAAEAMNALEFEAGVQAYEQAAALDAKWSEALSKALNRAASKTPARDEAAASADDHVAAAQAAIAEQDAGEAMQQVDLAHALLPRIGRKRRDALAIVLRDLEDAAGALREEQEAPIRRRRRNMLAAAAAAAVLIILVTAVALHLQDKWLGERIAGLEGRRGQLIVRLQEEVASLYAADMAGPWDKALAELQRIESDLRQRNADAAEARLMAVEAEQPERSARREDSDALRQLSPVVEASSASFAAAKRAIGVRFQAPLWAESEQALNDATTALEKRDRPAAEAAMARYAAGAVQRDADVAHAGKLAALSAALEAAAAELAGERKQVAGKAPFAVFERADALVARARQACERMDGESASAALALLGQERAQRDEALARARDWDALRRQANSLQAELDAQRKQADGLLDTTTWDEQSGRVRDAEKALDALDNDAARSILAAVAATGKARKESLAGLQALTGLRSQTQSLGSQIATELARAQGVVPVAPWLEAQRQLSEADARIRAGDQRGASVSIQKVRDEEGVRSAWLKVADDLAAERTALRKLRDRFSSEVTRPAEKSLSDLLTKPGTTPEAAARAVVTLMGARKGMESEWIASRLRTARANGGGAVSAPADWSQMQAYFGADSRLEELRRVISTPIVVGPTPTPSPAPVPGANAPATSGGAAGAGNGSVGAAAATANRYRLAVGSVVWLKFDTKVQSVVKSEDVDQNTTSTWTRYVRVTVQSADADGGRTLEFLVTRLRGRNQEGDRPEVSFDTADREFMEDPYSRPNIGYRLAAEVELVQVPFSARFDGEGRFLAFEDDARRLLRRHEARDRQNEAAISEKDLEALACSCLPPVVPRTIAVLGSWTDRAVQLFASATQASAAVQRTLARQDDAAFDIVSKGDVPRTKIDATSMEFANDLESILLTGGSISGRESASRTDGCVQQRSSRISIQADLEHNGMGTLKLTQLRETTVVRSSERDARSR